MLSRFRLVGPALRFKRKSPLRVPLSKPAFQSLSGVRSCHTASQPLLANVVAVPQIGKPAPDFKAQALVPDGSFKEISLSDYKGKYLVLFFYPLDFTFVCPTEIIAFSEKAEDFRKVGAEVVGASIDSVYTHLAWTKTPQKEGGLGKLNIPLIADVDRALSQKYGVLFGDKGFSLRGLFIISPKGILRQITMNEPPVGRNVDEVLRLVQAFKHVDEHGEVCPINWKPGSDGMKPDPEKSKTYFQKHGH